MARARVDLARGPPLPKASLVGVIIHDVDEEEDDDIDFLP
jgi:hypothetical protein